jgi:hypothetical protein
MGESSSLKSTLLFLEFSFLLEGKESGPYIHD